MKKKKTIRNFSYQGNVPHKWQMTRLQLVGTLWYTINRTTAPIKLIYIMFDSDASERSICSAQSAQFRDATLLRHRERHKPTIWLLILSLTILTEGRSRVFYILSVYLSKWLSVTCKSSWITSRAAHWEVVLYTYSCFYYSTSKKNNTQEYGTVK